jgi:hypothetical protein
LLEEHGVCEEGISRACRRGNQGSGQVKKDLEGQARKYRQWGVTYRLPFS